MNIQFILFMIFYYNHILNLYNILSFTYFTGLYSSSNQTSDASCSTAKSKLNKQSHSSLLHIVSVGYDIMILEFWADTKAG